MPTEQQVDSSLEEQDQQVTDSNHSSIAQEDILSDIDFERLTEKTGVEPYTINGIMFFTVKQFSKLINRSRIRVRELTNVGNGIRTLKKS